MGLLMIWILMLPTAGFSFRVKVSSLHPVAQVGDKLVLTCAAEDCAGNKTFVIKPLGDSSTNFKYEVNEAATVIFNSVKIEDEQDLICQVNCGSEKKQKQIKVGVYAFPQDPLISGNSEIVEGQEGRLTCSIPNVYPVENVRVEWLYDGQITSDDDFSGEGDVPQTVSSTFPFNLTAKDSGKNVTCRAVLKFESASENPKTRESTVQLTIRAPPRKANITVNPTGPVKEGDRVTISCQSYSVTAGHMTLHRVNDAQQTELLSATNVTLSYTFHSITLEDTGLYTCGSFDEYGSVNDTVWIVVRAAPRNTTVQASPSWNVAEGQNITITWSTVSFPAATAVLRRLSDGSEVQAQNGTFHLQNVRISDAGSYLLTVTNDLGQDKRTVDINVLERYTKPSEESPDLKKAVLPTVGFFTLLASVSAVIRQLRKARLKSKYSLVSVA